jgi:hypothetical protein
MKWLDRFLEVIKRPAATQTKARSRWVELPPRGVRDGRMGRRRPWIARRKAESTESEWIPWCGSAEGKGNGLDR